MKREVDLDNTSRANREKPPDEEIAAVLGLYLDRCARGEDPRLTEFLAQYAHLGSELKTQLETIARIDATFADTPLPSLFGDDYRIIAEAGRGGMGIVYKAWQISLDRQVALKVLPASLLADPKAVERFRREAKVAASLNHPSIVSVYAMGVELNVPYFAMEFAEGETLQQIRHRVHSSTRVSGGETGTMSVWANSALVDRWSTIEPAEPSTQPATEGVSSASDQRSEDLTDQFCRRLAFAFAGAADGLHHAHARGVFHRDLKPSNLMLDPSGRLRILDFGLAQVDGHVSLTLTSERVGTPLYMSPEQVRFEGRLGAGTDIYSLGATLYEMLAGRTPFVGKRYEDILHQIVYHEAPLLRGIEPRIARDLETIVMKCLRKSPEERYATAEALSQDLRRFVRGEPIEARPQPLLNRVVSRLWRSRWRIAESCAVGVLLLALILAFAGHVARKGREKDERYIQDVREGVMKLAEKQLLPLASVEGRLLPLTLDGRTGTDGYLVNWQHRLIESGARATVEAGPAFARIVPNPALEAADKLRRAINDFPRRPIAYYHLARSLLVQGRILEAREPLRRALSLDPSFVPALSLEILLLSKDGDPNAQAAHTRLEDAVAARGRGWESEWLSANQALLDHDWEAAEGAYDRLLAGQDGGQEEESYLGSMIEALLGRGVARMQAGHAKEAIGDFEEAFRKWPRWLEPALLLGRSHYLEKNPKKAAAVFQGAFDRATEVSRPAGVEFARAIANSYMDLGDFAAASLWVDRMEGAIDRDLMKAELTALQGRFADARDMVHGVIDRQPSLMAAHFALGNVLRLEGRHGEARSAYDKALELAPGDPRPLIQIGLCHEVNGDSLEALKAFQTAGAMAPGAFDALYNAARILTRLERTVEAKALYQEILGAHPGNAPAHNNLGTLLDLEGDLDGALESYRNATRCAPRFLIARYNLGWALHRKQRHAEAEVEYLRALADDPEDALLHAHLAASLYNQGRFMESAAEYRKVVELEPQYAAAHHHLGASLLRLGIKSDAVECYRRAVELKPEWAEAHNDLGDALERFGRIEHAIQEYERAIELQPDSPWAYKHLAGILLRTWQPLPAVEDLRNEILRWEAAQDLPHAGREVSCLLDTYRRAFLPRLASFTSVERVIERPKTGDGGDTWRLLRGRSEPPADWMKDVFDDSSWETGTAPFFYPAFGESGTLLEDMQGNYSTIYLRRWFTIQGPVPETGLTLAVQADDGYVVYLNGNEVRRQRVAGTSDSVPHDAAADDFNWDPLIPDRIQLAKGALREGENVLTLQGVNLTRRDTDFYLSVEIEYGQPDTDERSRRARALIEGCRELRRDAEEEAIPLYLEGRALQLEGHSMQAALKFAEVIEAGSTAKEPFLRLAECHRIAGEKEARERVLRSALEVGCTAPEVWDEWVSAVLVDLHQSPREILSDFPRVAAGAAAPDPRRGDILWLLETLSRGDALRIDCGAERACGAWTRDRFFLSGSYGDLYKVRRRGLAKGLIEAHWTERYFSGADDQIPAYAIPLPPGLYRVTLHLGEGYHEEPAKRRYDVLLEGETVLPDYAPPDVRSGAPHLESRVVQTDGILDISFRRRAENPNILAIEVAPVKDR